MAELRALAQRRPGGRRSASPPIANASRSNPSFGDAYWSLANLEDISLYARRGRGDAQARWRAPTSKTKTAITCIFRSARRWKMRPSMRRPSRTTIKAIALRRASVSYSAEDVTAHLKPLEGAVYARRSSTSAREWARPAADPIFIVGLPRAGSTLIEQILSSHSHVEGTMELADHDACWRATLSEQKHEIRSLKVPEILATLGRRTSCGRLGEELSSRAHAFTARRASRSSSTRCRTISPISA